MMAWNFVKFVNHHCFFGGCIFIHGLNSLVWEMNFGFLFSGMFAVSFGEGTWTLLLFHRSFNFLTFLVQVNDVDSSSILKVYLSDEQIPGCWGYLGDEQLPSYIDIIS